MERNLNNVIENFHQSFQTQLFSFSKVPGYRLFFEKNLELSQVNYHFPRGQNPTSSTYLFSLECRYSSNCQGPCCFCHQDTSRVSDLLSLVKFKRTMFEHIKTTLKQKKIKSDFSLESDLIFLKDHLNKMEEGKFPKLKLYLMNHIYNNTLFIYECDNFRENILELEISFTFCLSQKTVSLTEIYFLLSLCYVPKWIEHQIYLFLIFNGQLLNIDTHN
jgi:hypothetical protein